MCQREMGQFQRSCASAGYQSGLLAPARSWSCLLAVGGSPCDDPHWVREVRGAARGWWDTRSSRSGAGDLPSPQYPATPLVSVFPVSLPFPVWFPSPLRIPALVLPRETQLLANGVAFCWLSSCQGLDGPQGEGRTWSREIITCGGSCSPKRLQVPRTSLVPWLKLVALNQLRLLHLKGREGLL